VPQGEASPTQTLLKQQPPLWHWLLGQQGLPGVPQATQTPPEQRAFAPLQVLVPLVLVQQGPPRSPHLAQVPEVHLVPGDVHVPLVLDPQHGKPGPPQVPQAPALHVPPPRFTQVPPTAMQIPETQHPPPLHVLASQHGVPGSPQRPGPVPPDPGAPPKDPPLPGRPPPLPSTPPLPGRAPSSSVAASGRLDFPPHPWDAATPTPPRKKTATRKPRPLDVTYVLLRTRTTHRHPRPTIIQEIEEKGANGRTAHCPEPVRSRGIPQSGLTSGPG
jgi:hypothetical protein